MNRFFRSWLAVWMLCAAPAWSHAEDVTEASNTQRQFNDQGVKMMLEGNHRAAIGMFQSSLNFGELNLTLVNLGRAHAKLGHCEAARQHYQRARHAPKVPEPTPEQIAQLLERFERELNDDCSAFLDIRCQPAEGKVQLNDRDETSCSDPPRNVVPGKHIIVATWSTPVEATATTAITVTAGETVAVDIQPPPPAAETAPTPMADTPADTTPAARNETPSALAHSQRSEASSTIPLWIGRSLTGLGALTLATSLVLNYTYVLEAREEVEQYCSFDNDICTLDAAEAANASASRDKLQDAQTNNRIIMSVGGAALVGGLVMILLNADTETEDAAVEVTVTEKGMDLSVGWAW